MLRDPLLAEDAAQDAVIEALLGLERLRQAERFGPWLAGIGLNICRRWLRYRSRESWSSEALYSHDAFPELPDRQPGPEELAEAAELRERVRHAVAELPPGQRDAVLLFYLADLTQAETAATLGVQVSAVKTRLHKARANLRNQLHTSIGDTMSVQAAGWIDFQVVDVRRQTRESRDASVPDSAETLRRHWLVLEELHGSRRSIWGIPPFEADALAMMLHGHELPRPSAYALMAQLLQAAGGQVREVRMELLAERAVGARILVESQAGEREVEAKASDAVNLALVLEVPIRLSAAMLKDDDDEDSELDRQALNRIYAENTEGSAAIAAERAERIAKQRRAFK